MDQTHAKDSVGANKSMGPQSRAGAADLLTRQIIRIDRHAGRVCQALRCPRAQAVYAGQATSAHCFLTETHKTVLDHLVEMHSQYLIGMNRRSPNALEKRRRKLRPRVKRGLDTMLRVLEILLDPERPRETVLTELYLEIDEPRLLEALRDCRAYQRLEDRGLVDDLCARHTHLKRYLPSFLELPFQAAPGTQPLLDAIALACRLQRGEVKALPMEVHFFRMCPT